MQDSTLYESNKRGFWLSAYLIVGFTSSLIGTLVMTIYAQDIVQFWSELALTPSIEVTDIYILSAASFISLIFTVGVWLWRKWAVYGMFLTMFISAVYNLYQGQSWGMTIISLVFGTYVTYLVVVKNRWHCFH
ncbi:hypothetical protein L4C34_11510 [Vibrio profundum]|uniref:hypothetical protein n=1 Tax=Vibrio profundum TaxID=2910247 RepID=UPI003D09F54C